MVKLLLSVGESPGTGGGLLSSWSPLRAFNTRQECVVEHTSNEPHNHEPENVVAHATVAHDHDVSSGLDLDILGFSLPDVILFQIFSEFLSLEDISRLDIAICNHNKRRLFLQCIQHESCFWSGNKDEDSETSSFLPWIESRCITIRHLYCRNVSYDMARSGSIGNSLHLLSIKCTTVHYNQDNIDRSIAELAKGCPNLLHLHLSNFMGITDISISVVADECHNLQSLSLSSCRGISDIGIIKIAEACPCLESLDLFDCSQINDVSIIRIGERSHSLRSIDLSRCTHITDVSIIAIAEGCPNLRNLNLNQCSEITDVSIIMIAESCPDLQSLNLTRNRNITDVSMIRIAERCHNLQKLYLGSCQNITDVSILTLKEQCLRLLPICCIFK